MCRVIAIANQKGGCSKTTTSINLGVGLARLGEKVLLVDNDPQGHMTMGLGFPKNLRVTLKTMMENIIMGVEFDPKEGILHHIEGILFTMDNCRYNNSKRNKKAICDAYGNELNIFQDSIPRLEAIAETASEGISIFEYAENSKGADSYGRLAEEVLNHGKKSK